MITNLKGSKGKKLKVTYKGTPLSYEQISQLKLYIPRESRMTFKVLEDKNCEPRILYLAKLSFKYEGKIKPFPDKQKLREFKIIRPVSQEMLEEVIQAKVESC